MHVMVVLALLRVAVFPLQTLLMLEEQAGRALERQPERLAVRPALRVLRALPLLLVDYLGKVAAAVAAELGAQAVLAELADAALVVEAVVHPAVHMPQAPVV